MTILNIPRKIFEKEIGKIDENLKEKINLFGTPIEALDDDKIDIEIFPNRPDLLSYQNYKNSFLSFIGKKSGLISYKVNKAEKDFIVNIENSVKDIRPFTACAIVKGLKLDNDKIKEIIDIQEKLHLSLGRKRKKAAIGIYPLEKIKLPIKYEARNPEDIKFQPLEFPNVINGKQILNKHPAGKEYSHLLEGFDKYPVFIDSNNEILSMPPIINSHNTGKIDENTKDVFIECSGYNLELLNKILNIIVITFSEMGGKIYQMKLKYGNKEIITPNLNPIPMKISIENTNKLLGLNLKELEIKKLLEKAGYNYSKGNVLTPAWRVDILHEVDLIEDIAISYGYDKFIPEIPKISTIGKIDRIAILKEKISELLIGLGLIETSSYHLINKDTIKKIGLSPNDFIKVNNSKTEYEYLRKDLSSFLLKILSENVDVEYPHEIFQLGRIFDEYNEKESLAVSLTPGNFTKVKQILEYLGKNFDIELSVKQTKIFPPYYIEGRVAEVIFNGKVIGYLGEVHPSILKSLRIKMPVGLFEISLDEIYKKFE